MNDYDQIQRVVSAQINLNVVLMQRRELRFVSRDTDLVPTPFNLKGEKSEIKILATDKTIVPSILRTTPRPLSKIGIPHRDEDPAP